MAAILAKQYIMNECRHQKLNEGCAAS